MGAQSNVDLLIVGAGPAGLITAAWASQYKIRTRIIDENPSRVENGRADGLQSRTMEILHSFGLAEHITKQAAQINEICSWNSNHERPDEICRSQAIQSQPPGLSRYPQLALNQGATEQLLLDYLETHGAVHVERGMAAVSIQYNDAGGGVHSKYPVKVGIRRTSGSNKDDDLKHASEHDEKLEYVDAKYVVGCDGSHSLVRRVLNIEMEGDDKDEHFGVADVIPLTDFPDIRESCVIHSRHGSIMTVPRENRLVRLYVQLDDENGSKVTSEENPRMDSETILAHAKSIFHPYKFDFRVCDWSSVYTVGQRLARRFEHCDRIFLAGDAVHTHSPTLGQGMNISMQDAYNLGWKICSVLKGTLSPAILCTYTAERRPVTQHLMKLDKDMTEFYSKGPHRESEDYHKFRSQFSEFVSGVSVTYGLSDLILEPTEQGLISNSVQVGKRLPSYEVISHAEGIKYQVHDLLPSNGKWRIVVFPGRLQSPAIWDRTEKLGDSLHKLLTKFTTVNQRIHSVIEVILIHAGGRRQINMLDLHNVFHPWDEEEGWDYWKVFCEPSDDSSNSSYIYDELAISRDRGCMLAIRPDQHVSAILPLQSTEQLDAFFSNFMQFSAKKVI